jgi:surface protein
MPNSIKYSTSAQSLALKKGNFWIGTGDVEKGPTQSTDYWNGITPPSLGYTIYLNKDSQGPSILCPSSDSSLINLTNSISGQNFSTTKTALNWYNTQTDKMVFNKDYEAIVTNGLVLNLDPGFTPSYPKGGTSWYDISSGGNNGALINGTSFNEIGGGSMVFDGIDDYISTTYSGITGTNPRTISIWFRPEITQNKNLLGYGTGNTMRMWDVILYDGLVGVHLYTSGAEAGTPYTVGVWQNIVFTFTYPTITSYMDGVFKATYTNSNINTGTDNLLSIARGVFAAYYYYNGSMGPIQIYNRSLTAQEVLQNYNAMKNRYIFTSTWRTSNTSSGSSTSTQVKLPLVSTGTYNMLVDWGDGSTDTITTWDQTQTTHTYANSGDYTIKISGICRGWYFNNTGDRLKLLDISQYGILNLSVGRAFWGCTNFNPTAIDAPIISATNMEYTFLSCTNFNGNVNNWDVSNVTSLRDMFNGCTNFNQPLNNWNVSKVFITAGMFQSAINFNQDLSSWDVSSVYVFGAYPGYSVSGMFYGATNFNNGGNPGINNWQIKNNVNDVSFDTMFFGCTKFNQPIGNWNTSGVNNMNAMFNGATLFNQDIISWNTSNVTNMSTMFQNAINFNQNISSWDVSKVTSLSRTFTLATSFNQNLSSWDLRLAGVNLNEIFFVSGMSCQNYTDTIVGWANYVATNSNTPINVNMATQTGRIFDGARSGGAGFASATAARLFLTTATPTGAGWTISGDTLGSC